MNQEYQLTIRLSGPVAERVRALAKEQSLSLNQAVIRLLERGTDLDRRPGAQIGKRLERFVGLLSSEEAREGTASAADAFGRVDPELWK